MNKSNENNLIFSFHAACPKYQNKVISLNKSDISKWVKWQEAVIKNEYKDNLKEWHIPDPEDGRELTNAWLEFRLFRHTGRKFDSDNLGFIIKWTIDAIKEMGWLKDDDQIIYTVFPSVVDKTLAETEIKVSMFYEYSPEKE